MYNLSGILNKRLPPALLGGSGFTTLYVTVITFATGFNPDSGLSTVKLCVILPLPLLF